MTAFHDLFDDFPALKRRGPENISNPFSAIAQWRSGASPHRTLIPATDS
jgi:hypothetical protein